MRHIINIVRGKTKSKDANANTNNAASKKPVKEQTQTKDTANAASTSTEDEKKKCPKKLEDIAANVRKAEAEQADKQERQAVANKQTQADNPNQKATPTQTDQAPAAPADTKCVAHDLDIKCTELQQLGYLPLTVISACGDVERARTLLDKLANVNERCQRDGSTPLMLAAHNKHHELVKLLLTNGADCTLTNQEGLNAFMMAVRSGDANIVNTMWPYGQNKLFLDHKDIHGNTVLHLAAKRKWDCCVHFLLTHGASHASITKKGQTALMICAEQGDQKTAERLIESGADILCEDGSGYTAICISFDDGKKEMMTFLLDKLPEDRRDQYVKSRMDYLTDPPEFEEERDYTEEHIIPLLGRITSRPQYRNAFLNQRVIPKILDKAKENIQNLNMMKVTSKLICEIIFYFSEEVDGKFVRQYIQCKGPDFTINTLKYYTEKMRLPEKDTILYFLPMVSISEVQEGSVWLSKNYLLVSEYTNFFKGTLAHCVHPPDYSGTYTKLLKRMEPVWQHFLNVVNELQSKNRERQMVQLLEEEEREKDRQIKKREKKRQKRQEKQKKKGELDQEETPDTIMEEKQQSPLQQKSVESNIKECIECIVVKVHESDSQEKTSKTKKKDKKSNKPKNDVETVDTFMDFRDRLSPCDKIILENKVSSVISAPVGYWHTVQAKRQPNKDKDKEITTIEIKGKDKDLTAIEKKETANAKIKEKKERKERREKKISNPVAKKFPAKEQKQTSNATTHAVNSHIRWSDVARGQQKQTHAAIVQTVRLEERQKHGIKGASKNKCPWTFGDVTVPATKTSCRNDDSKSKIKQTAKERAPKKKAKQPSTGNDFGTLLEAELNSRSPLVLPTYNESLPANRQADGMQESTEQRNTDGPVTIHDAMEQMRDMLLSSPGNCGSLVSNLRRKLVEGNFATDEFDNFVEYFFPMKDEMPDCKKMKANTTTTTELKNTHTDTTNLVECSKQLIIAKPDIDTSSANIFNKEHSEHVESVLECGHDDHQDGITTTMDFRDMEQALQEPGFLVMFQEHQRITVNSLETEILLHRENCWLVPGFHYLSFPPKETLAFKQYANELIDDAHIEFQKLQERLSLNEKHVQACKMPENSDNQEKGEVINTTVLEHIEASKGKIDTVVTSTKTMTKENVIERISTCANSKNTTINDNALPCVVSSQNLESCSMTCSEQAKTTSSCNTSEGISNANAVTQLVAIKNHEENVQDVAKQSGKTGQIKSVGTVPKSNKSKLCDKEQQKPKENKHNNTEDNIKREVSLADISTSQKNVQCETQPSKSKDDKTNVHTVRNIPHEKNKHDNLKCHEDIATVISTQKQPQREMHVPTLNEHKYTPSVHTHGNRTAQKNDKINVKEQIAPITKKDTSVASGRNPLTQKEDKHTTTLQTKVNIEKHARVVAGTNTHTPMEKCKRPNAPAVIMPRRVEYKKQAGISMKQDEKTVCNIKLQERVTIINASEGQIEVSTKPKINIVHCIRPKRLTKPCIAKAETTEQSQSLDVVNRTDHKELSDIQLNKCAGDSKVIVPDQHEGDDEEHTVFSDSSDEDCTVFSDDSDDESTLCSDHSVHEDDSDETTAYSSDEQVLSDTNKGEEENVPCWYTNKESFNEEIRWEDAAAAFPRDEYTIDPPEDSVATADPPSDPAIIECGIISCQTTEDSNVHSQDIMSQLYKAIDIQSNTDNDQSLIKENIVTYSADEVHVTTTDSITKVSRLNSYMNGTKQTAIIKPMQTSEPSDNCALGQSILTNATNLHSGDNDDFYPTDIEGNELGHSEYKHNHNQSNGDNSYFPGFHDQTKLSAHYDPTAVSMVHKMQQLQLIQMQQYYDAMLLHMMDPMSIYRTDFPYYASCAGMNQSMYMNWQQNHRAQQNLASGTCNTAENQPTQTQTGGQNGYNDSQTWMHPGNDDQAARNQPMMHGDKVFAANNTKPQEAATHADNTTVPIDEVKRRSNIATGRAVRVKPMPTYRYNADENVPPTNPQSPQPPNTAPVTANAQGIYQIAAAAANDMREAYKAMTSATILSKRWHEKLAQIQQLPPHELVLIGKILVPRHNQEQYVISHGSEPITLGFLSDGTEVAVKLISCRSRALTPVDLQLLVDMNVTENFVIQYKAFSCYQGFYYIATDLYEYRLDEYIHKLQAEGPDQDSDVNIQRTVWQLFRGLASLHQHRLMVHGELRPSNVVTDLVGKVKISGYGLGRKVNCGSVLAEFSDEDRCWLAPEVLVHKQTDSFKSDINVAGMLLYYILSGGHNPYGAQTDEIVWNISHHNFVMEYISEEAMHLLSLMLSINKAGRPCISDAAKHPMFWGEELTARFVLIAGSDVLRDLKAGVPLTGNGGDTMIDILNSVPIANQLNNWISAIDPVVMGEMRTFRQYKNHFVELVLFVYNVCLHFDKMTDESREIIDEPCRYFQARVPTMFMAVYRAVKASNRTERTCYKPFF